MKKYYTLYLLLLLLVPIMANGQYSAKLHNLNSGVFFLRVSRQGGSFATHRFTVK